MTTNDSTPTNFGSLRSKHSDPFAQLEEVIEKETNNRELKCVWSFEGDKGEPVALRCPKEVKEYVVSIRPGSYFLYAHTTANRLGGDFRYVTLEMGVENPGGSVVLSGTYRLDGIRKTIALEFVTKGTSTIDDGKFSIRIQTHFPGNIGVVVKLFKNKNPGATEYYTNWSRYVYKTMTIESITSEMYRRSDDRVEITRIGMLRPFLFLVSMHPAARQRLADAMAIDIHGPNFGDAHAEARAILTNHRRSLQVSSSSLRSLNPTIWRNGDGPNWSTCLCRILKEDYGEAHEEGGEELFLENALLHAIASVFLNTVEISIPFREKLSEMINTPAIGRMYTALASNGITDETVKRFVVALCLYLKEKGEGTEQDDTTKLVAKKRPETQEYLSAIKEQLLVGPCDLGCAKPGIIRRNKSKRSYTAIVHILLQRLVLASHGINIDQM